MEPVRIGVIADTHCSATRPLPPSVLTAFEGCDVIVHCGDVGAKTVLTELGRIAPVMTPKAKTLLTFERAGHQIAACLMVDTAAGAEADLVLHGGDHVAAIYAKQGVLHVDPGSPTLPSAGGPTVAIVTLEGDVIRAEMISLG